jgi:hypothetical protein
VCFTHSVSVTPFLSLRGCDRLVGLLVGGLTGWLTGVSSIWVRGREGRNKERGRKKRVGDHLGVIDLVVTYSKRAVARQETP